LFEQDLFKFALKKWGEEFQIKMAIEECSELITELAKYGRNINGTIPERIISEIVDVEIMLKQLKIMFINKSTDKNFYNKVYDAKIQKLREIINR